MYRIYQIADNRFQFNIFLINLETVDISNLSGALKGKEVFI